MGFSLIKKIVPKPKKALAFDVFVILILGFLSITWFRGNNLISGGDFGMPLDWVKYLKLMQFVWDETISLGNPDYRQVASLIPYAITGGILQSLGFSLIFIEKFLFYIWFAGTGLSMYYLCHVLNMRRPGKLFASIFYMLNPFSLIIIWRPSHGLVQMPYTFAPLYLGLYINGLKRKKGLAYIIFAVLLWLVTTTSSYAWPAAVIMHWIPIFFYGLSVLIRQPKRRLFTLKFSLLFVLTWVFLNFYWFFPFVVSLSESLTRSQSPFLVPDLELIKLTSVKFLEAIRMLGYWSMKGGYKGEPYYPYWQYYNSLFIISISWLIPLLVILGFFHKDVRKKPLIFFFVSLIIFGLFGISSAYSPIGEFMIKFYSLFPPLAILTRFNFLFFGLPTYLIFSVLIGFGLLTIYEYGFKKIGHFILTPLVILMILLTVVLVFPFWNGEVIRGEGELFPGERFKVPAYWWEAKKWLSQQKDFFRILPLPMSTTYNMDFYWGEGYSGGDPTRWLSNQPVLNVNTEGTFEVPMLIGEAIEKEITFKDIAKLFGFLNVKYLLVRNDIRWEMLKGHGWWFNHNPENIEKFIKNQPGLTLEKKIGQLEFYRLEESYLLPHIYTPSIITLIDGEAGSFLDLAQFLQPEKGEGVILFQQNKGKRFAQGPDFIWRPALASKKDKHDILDSVFYKMYIFAEGEFEILLRNNDSLKFYQTERPFKIIIDDGAPEERTFTLVEDNLFSLGQIQLSKGNHKITLFPPPVVNLVDNSSFEEATGEFEQSTDAFKDDYALKLTATKKTNIFSIPINNFKVGESYQASFFTKNLKGQPARLVLWENYTDSETPVLKRVASPFGAAYLETSYSEVTIPPVSSWKEARLTFTPNLQAKSTGLSFVSYANFKEGTRIIKSETENLFDDIIVQRFFNNPLILRPLFQERQLLKPPKISFKKISPVKYEVEVVGAKEPYILVFSESFHPGWTSSVEGEHFMVNGFANAWQIKKTGDYKITLFFKPQEFHSLGAGVSLLSMVFSVVYLGIYSKFKKQTKSDS